MLSSKALILAFLASSKPPCRAAFLCVALNLGEVGGRRDIMSWQPSYTGPERRRGQRRQQIDRRLMVRWEPEKTDRRQNAGRRQDDILNAYWRL